MKIIHVNLIRAHDGHECFEWSASLRSTDTIRTVSWEDSERGWLGRILGNNVVIQQLTFQTDSNAFHQLFYHPGPILGSAKGTWDLVKASLRFSEVHSEFRHHRATKPNEPIPQEVLTRATREGVESIDDLYRAYNHFRDAMTYPEEGYYLTDNVGFGVFIKGKLHSSYILSFSCAPRLWEVGPLDD